MIRIAIVPAAQGWSVCSKVMDNDQFFMTGAAAERAGKRLAMRWADAGETVTLTIHLRDGSTAATFLFAPHVAPEPCPHDLAVKRASLALS